MEAEIFNKCVMLKCSSPSATWKTFLVVQTNSMVPFSDFWKAKGWMERTGQNMRIMTKNEQFSKMVPYFHFSLAYFECSGTRGFYSVIWLYTKYS